MNRLPSVDFKTIDKVLLNLGFERVRQKGNHILCVTLSQNYLPMTISQNDNTGLT